MIGITLSIVSPVYQNRDSLAKFVDEVLSVVGTIPNAAPELVFVDDRSTDGSFAVLRALQCAHPENVTVLRLSRNFGQTPAIQAGIAAATGDCVAVISADLQDPPELIATMVGAWRDGHKVVVAERSARHETRLMRFVSGSYWRFVRSFAVPGFPKGGVDFCLLDRTVCNALSKIEEKNTSVFPLIYWLGFEPLVVSYERRQREAGASQWSLRKKVRLGWDTVLGFSQLPAQGIATVGLAAAALSFCFGTRAVYRYLAYGSFVQGWSTLVVLISFFGGLVLLSLGVVLEYLWRILEEARNRPAFIIDEVVGRESCQDEALTIDR